MKRAYRLAALASLILNLAPGCKKNDRSTQSDSSVTVSKSLIKRGEQVFATAAPSNATDIVKWALKPGAYDQVLPSGKSAIAIFAVAGNYQITASYYSAADTMTAYSSSSAAVMVSDSIFQSPLIENGTDTLALQGGGLILSPLLASDSGLVVSAQTTNLYNCSAYITAESWQPAPPEVNFWFDNAEVVENNSNCNGAKSPAISLLFLAAMPNGTFDVNAIYGNVTYHGTLTVTDSYYTFSWGYASGVVISPLQIRRQ
jgi:hypothetical protein